MEHVYVHVFHKHDYPSSTFRSYYHPSQQHLTVIDYATDNATDNIATIGRRDCSLWSHVETYCKLQRITTSTL